MVPQLAPGIGQVYRAQKVNLVPVRAPPPDLSGLDSGSIGSVSWSRIFSSSGTPSPSEPNEGDSEKAERKRRALGRGPDRGAKTTTKDASISMIQTVPSPTGASDSAAVPREMGAPPRPRSRRRSSRTQASGRIRMAMWPDRPLPCPHRTRPVRGSSRQDQV